MEQTVSILLYYANLLCYFRIFLIIMCIFYENCAFVLFYSLSSFLDILDGLLARKFNQVSSLGANLDMLIDRLLNIIMLIKLKDKLKNKKHHRILVSLFTLDFLSNLMNFNASSILSCNHKATENRFLNFYYEKRNLYLICSSTEIGFVLMYLFPNLFILFVVPYLFKSFFHVIHMDYAINLFLKIDDKKGK